MSYEQLSLSSFIKEMKDVTDGPHPRKFCFVLGAGASRTSGIKSGQELVRIWDKDLRSRNETEYHRWRNALGITDENMSGFYSQYYEKRFQRCRTDGYNYIEKIMDSAKPSAGYVMLAHLLTTTPHNVVITTNFDHLTEDAVNYYAQSTPLVIGHEALAHYVSGQPVRPTIIKIHRDLLFDPKSRTEDLERLPDSWKTALELIFENYHPVFIGYAGNDKSLMDFLVENGKKFANDEWKFPYWLLYGAEPVEGKVKEFLEQSDGYFIYHNGFDDVLIQIGAAFDYTIPTEQDFLEDARKRYKALADAIDAFSDEDKGSNKADSITIYLEAPKNNKSEKDKQGVNQAIEKITNQSEIQRMYWEGTTLYGEEKYAEAAKIFQRLVELEPENARYHGNLANSLYWLKKEDEALEECRKAIELEPENDIYHFWAGFILEGMEQYQEALEEYSRSVYLRPDDGMNHYCLANVLFLMGKYEEALSSVQRAITFDEVDFFYDLLSLVLTELERHEEAEKAKEKARELRNKGDNSSN